MIDQERGLLLSMVCDDDGRRQPVGVLFVKPRAFRKREEIYCTGWHVKNVYDTVCEIRESDWWPNYATTLCPNGATAGSCVIS